MGRCCLGCELEPYGGAIWSRDTPIPVRRDLPPAKKGTNGPGESALVEELCFQAGLGFGCHRVDPSLTVKGYFSLEVKFNSRAF